MGKMAAPANANAAPMPGAVPGVDPSMMPAPMADPMGAQPAAALAPQAMQTMAG